jgi:hypothetical protein
LFSSRGPTPQLQVPPVARPRNQLKRAYFAKCRPVSAVRHIQKQARNCRVDRNGWQCRVGCHRQPATSRRSRTRIGTRNTFLRCRRRLRSLKLGPHDIGGYLAQHIKYHRRSKEPARPTTSGAATPSRGRKRDERVNCETEIRLVALSRLRSSTRSDLLPKGEVAAATEVHPREYRPSASNTVAPLPVRPTRFPPSISCRY